MARAHRNEASQFFRLFWISSCGDLRRFHNTRIQAVACSRFGTIHHHPTLTTWVLRSSLRTAYMRYRLGRRPAPKVVRQSPCDRDCFLVALDVAKGVSKRKVVHVVCPTQAPEHYGIHGPRHGEKVRLQVPSRRWCVCLERKLCKDVADGQRGTARSRSVASPILKEAMRFPVLRLFIHVKKVGHTC